jgi:glycosyltransferase involved in cell wall biosynthesis
MKQASGLSERRLFESPSTTHCCNPSASTVLRAVLWDVLRSWRLTMSPRRREPRPARAVKQRLRIAMFAHNYLPHPGGLEVMVWSITRRLARRHDVILVTSAYDGVSGVAREEGVVVHRLPAVHVTESLSVPYPVLTGAGVRAALDGVAGADVIHAHGALYLQTALARHVARRHATPLVLTEHVGFVEYRRAILNGVQRLAWTTIGDSAIRAADAVVTCSGRVRRWLGERSGRDVRYIGNAVDLERFRPPTSEERRKLRHSFGLPESETLALFVGRQSAKKNLDVVLGIPRDNFTLVVCGGRRALKGEKLIDLGIIPYDRMAELFACADLMVHPASGEGFPLAVLESVASGVPVVLLWDSGYADVISRDLVAACENLSDVGPQLAALAADAPRRAALASAGRAWAERHWSWDASADAYEEVYRDVIDRAHER